MTTFAQERNRAMRVAYNHARRGERELAEAWYLFASSFATPTPQQDTRLDDLLAACAGPIPGQMDFDGKVAVDV